MRLEWSEHGEEEQPAPPTESAGRLDPPRRPPHTAVAASADEPSPRPRQPAGARWGGARPPGPPPALAAFGRAALAAVEQALNGLDGLADRIAAGLSMRRR